MPRRKAPGPKSRTEKPSEKATQQRVASFLGDSTASDATNPNESNDESFGNPELEGDYTDYNLEYTLSPRSLRRSNQEPMPTREQIQQSTPNTPKRRSNQQPSHTQKQSQQSTSKRNTRTSRIDELEQSSEEQDQGQQSTSRRNTRPSIITEPQQSRKEQGQSKSNTRKEFLPREKKRKQKTPQQRENLMWKQIQKLQRQTENVTPKMPFGRLIRELLMANSNEANRITATALEALQISAELYLTQLFSDAYVCTLHRGRVTLGVHDIRLVRFLRGVSAQ